MPLFYETEQNNKLLQYACFAFIKAHSRVVVFASQKVLVCRKSRVNPGYERRAIKYFGYAAKS